ncbi:mycothiol system anti-sigma-R factor [Kocuria koreensis]|jgi:anti-sigma factor (TIGR02949 family)|uniref:Mycothiol system anti-sigma-R factor n=1 Tax=Rothia koreensis TaxID=592378 RepID=A0A7K1LFZ1_9MICC|nr:mycothiol system anti-sigma-R factor [Rothia koreensis]
MTDCQESGGCRDEQIQRIYEYLDGALSAEDIEDICTHLNECETCAREYDLECVIRSAVKRSCCEPAPDELKQSILHRIDSLRDSTESTEHDHSGLGTQKPSDPTDRPMAS